MAIFALFSRRPGFSLKFPNGSFFSFSGLFGMSLMVRVRIDTHRSSRQQYHGMAFWYTVKYSHFRTFNIRQNDSLLAA